MSLHFFILPLVLFQINRINQRNRNARRSPVMECTRPEIVPDKDAVVRSRHIMLIIYSHITQSHTELQVEMFSERHAVAVADAGLPVIALVAAFVVPLEVELASRHISAEEMAAKHLLVRIVEPPAELSSERESAGHICYRKDLPSTKGNKCAAPRRNPPL